MPPAPGPVPLSVFIDAAAPGRAISRDLIGIFFEDLSLSADGGLHADLIQNGSFAYSALSRRDWHPLTAWSLEERGGRGSLDLDAGIPLHPANPHHAVLEVREAGEVALLNSGYDGIAVRAGETYELALFARLLFLGARWDGRALTAPLPLVARLETPDGRVLAEHAFAIASPAWTPLRAALTPVASAHDARLALIARERGGLGLDAISLFPQNTFRARPCGLRRDLAETIAALRPRFLRFPGGCLVHGNGLGNIYRWKDSVGPRETRRQQHSIWRRHQSLGLGFFEYFQFCEDIGARPLPVVAAGVSCQNSGCTCGGGQHPIPLAEMPAYIQDVLDLIEYANGPADSPWGAVRAAAGHPEPFHLRHLGVGNEDKITPDFEARFRLIHDALRARHPEITVIGTVGPAAEGEDYEKGWAFARELGLPMVDEHYYKPAAWFWENLHRYDAYDRAGSRVYLGEYAAQEEDRRSTLRSALAEAAHLTALERNGDVVTFASYAPLLAKRGHADWSPDLIYFTNASVYPTINYEIQRLFSLHAGDHWLPARLDPAPAPGERLAVSTVRDSASGDLIVKLVNGDASARALRLEAPAFAFATAVATTLSAPDDSVAREDDRPDPVSLLTVPLTRSADGSLVHTLPAFSLTILRLSAAHPEAPSR